MRWKYPLIAVVLIAGIYLIASPLLRKNEPEIIQGMNPQEILLTAKKGEGIDSYKYRSEVKAGDQLNLNLTGRVSRGTNEDLLDFSWEGPQGYGEASAYFKGDRVLVYHPLKNRWLAPEEEKGLSSLLKMLSGQIVLLNPYRALNKVSFEEADIKTTGIEDVKGIKTTVVEVEPGKKASSWFEGILPPQLIGAKVSEVKQVYWIGNKDLRIHKYLLTAKIKILAIQVFEFRVHTTVDGFNETELNLPVDLVRKIDEGGL